MDELYIFDDLADPGFIERQLELNAPLWAWASWRPDVHDAFQRSRLRYEEAVRAAG